MSVGEIPRDMQRDSGTYSGQVHALTGVCPTVALHVSWDFPNGRTDALEVSSLASHFGVRAGAVNPNLFQDQEYKYGSFGNPAQTVRDSALRHCEESVAIARVLKSR